MIADDDEYEGLIECVATLAEPSPASGKRKRLSNHPSVDDSKHSIAAAHTDQTPMPMIDAESGDKELDESDDEVLLLDAIY